MNKRVVHFLGIFLIVIGISMTIPFITALICHETDQAGVFMLSIILCIIPGAVVTEIYKKDLRSEKIKIRDSYFIVTMSWILSSIFGCLPYILSGVLSDPLDAFFETASGFTTTGATLFARVEALPHSILIWRSLTQWLGGMGMVVLFFALLTNFGAKANTISSAETPGPIQRKLTSRYADTAQWFYFIYILLTVILTALLSIGGMSFFDAVNHSLTTLATGGFSTRTGGIGYFNSTYIYTVVGIFGFIAATNFSLFYDFLVGNIKSMFKDEEFRFYVGIVAVSVILITLSLKLGHHNASNATGDFTAAFFQVVNTISTLGAETANTAWPPFAIMILACLMMVGGCSSSTAGGIKISRFITLFKVVKREIKVRLHESVVEDIRLNNRKMSYDVMDYILSFVVLYLTVISAATMLICFAGGGDVMTNLLTVLSCISNLGPGLDSLGLVCQYHTESVICTITYTLVMIAGRLELSTFLVIFSRHFWNPDRV